MKYIFKFEKYKISLLFIVMKRFCVQKNLFQSIKIPENIDILNSRLLNQMISAKILVKN